MSSPLSPEAKRESQALLIGFFLILLVGGYFVGRFWWEGRNNEQAVSTASPDPEETAEIQWIEPRVLFEKLQNNEAITLVDIRPRAAYEVEHLPDSLSLAPGSLSTFSAPAGTAVVIITSAADPSAVELAQNALGQNAASFLFLQGGIEAWKIQGYQTISAGDPGSFLDQSKITYITPEELKTLLTTNSGTDNLVLLDVQSEANFRKSHLVGAINIPLDELEQRKDEIPAAKEIIVYGENELASFRGGVRLSDLHFFTVRTLTGNDHLSPSSPLFREPQL